MSGWDGVGHVREKRVRVSKREEEVVVVEEGTDPCHRDADEEGKKEKGRKRKKHR